MIIDRDLLAPFWLAHNATIWLHRLMRTYDAGLSDQNFTQTGPAIFLAGCNRENAATHTW